MIPFHPWPHDRALGAAQRAPGVHQRRCIRDVIHPVATRAVWRRSQHREILGAVEAVGRERIFGVVLNRAAPFTAGQYDPYEYGKNVPARA